MSALEAAEPVPSCSGDQVERAQSGLLAVLFCLPALLTLLVHFTPASATGLLSLPWLRNATLGGVQESHRSGQWTDELAWQFDHHFAGREALIRLTNELHLRVFREASTLTSSIVVGENFELMDRSALCDDLIGRQAPDTWSAQGARLRQLQDACRARGMAFVVLITPSKSATGPALIPATWLRHRDPRPDGYRLFTQLLNDHGITYVDGQDLMARAERTNPWPVPLFPQGGVHWGDWASFCATQELLEALRSQGVPVTPLRVGQARLVTPPHPEVSGANDGWQVLNLLFPWRQPVLSLQVRRESGPIHGGLSLVMVGTSFSFSLLEHLQASERFAETQIYFYWHERKTAFWKGGTRAWDLPHVSDWQRDIFGADCLVLEVNEAQTNGPGFLWEFCEQALRQLPPPGSLPQPFRYEHCLSWTWDRPLELGPAGPWSEQHLPGFSTVDPEGRWTCEDEASLALQLPPPEGDIQARFEVRGFVSSDHPLQSVILQANGQPVAHWDFRLDSLPVREVTIPRALVGHDGRLMLTLQIENPVSPAQLNQSDDRRRLGLLVKSLTLHQTNLTLPGTRYARCRWGQPVVVRDLPEATVDGFSGPESDGRWTREGKARIRLLLPADSRGSLQLRARVTPLWDPHLVASQRVRVYANGQLAGVWRFQGCQPPQTRELRLNGVSRRVELTFEMLRTVSPAEAGTSADARQLGLWFTDLTLERRP